MKSAPPPELARFSRARTRFHECLACEMNRVGPEPCNARLNDVGQDQSAFRRQAPDAMHSRDGIAVGVRLQSSTSLARCGLDHNVTNRPAMALPHLSNEVAKSGVSSAQPESTTAMCTVDEVLGIRRSGIAASFARPLCGTVDGVFLFAPLDSHAVL